LRLRFTAGMGIVLKAAAVAALNLDIEAAYQKKK
jgi:hypothetical protein